MTETAPSKAQAVGSWVILEAAQTGNHNSAVVSSRATLGNNAAKADNRLQEMNIEGEAFAIKTNKHARKLFYRKRNKSLPLKMGHISKQ